MCSMYHNSKHNGEDNLCSNTAVNEWVVLIKTLVPPGVDLKNDWIAEHWKRIYMLYNMS